MSKLAAFSGFMNNPAYATWFQSLIVGIAAVIALVTVFDADSNAKKNNTFAYVQRYNSDHPSLAQDAGDLRIAQFEIVQAVRAKIPNYDPVSSQATGFSHLLFLARPEVASKIRSDPALSRKYDNVSRFFLSFTACVGNGVCDESTSIELLSRDLLNFYNAVCPYTDELEASFHNEEESPAFLDFLVRRAGIRDEKLYFCRDKLASYLNR